VVAAQVPRRRGSRRAGAEEQGRSPRGCHGAGAVAARVPRRRGECRAGATEGLGAARVPRRRGGRRAGATEEGRAPRGCHGGGWAPRGCHGIAPDSVPSSRYLVSLQHRP